MDTPFSGGDKSTLCVGEAIYTFILEYGTIKKMKGEE